MQSDGTDSAGFHSSNLTPAGRETTSSSLRPWTCISSGIVTCSRHFITTQISKSRNSDAPSIIGRRKVRNSKKSAKKRDRFGWKCSLTNPLTLHRTTVYPNLQRMRLQHLPMISRGRQRGRKCFTIKLVIKSNQLEFTNPILLEYINYRFLCPITRKNRSARIASIGTNSTCT